jgi:hypothetical protein
MSYNTEVARRYKKHWVNARDAHVTRPCSSCGAETHVAHVTMFLCTGCVAGQAKFK